jgi:hypothetical protein
VKKLALVAGIILTMTGMAFAGTVTWENYAKFVYARAADGGGKIPVANNWVIALYQDAGSDNVMDDWDGSSSPLVTRQGGAWADVGYFSTSFTSAGGVSVFTRIYNASTIGAATWYVNLDGGVKAINALPLDTDTFYLDPGGSSANGTDWKPIPEPATLALFGLGLVTMAVGKRFRRK